MSFPIPQEWTPELDLAAAGVHPLREYAELAVVERFPVKPSVMRDLLGTAIRLISFSDPRIDEVSGRAIGTREKKRDDKLGGTERKLLLVGFRPVPGLPGSCRLAWIVLEEGSERPHEDDFRKTQVYLGSLVGNTAKYFMSILPKRDRASVSEGLSYESEGRSRTVNIDRELVDYLATNELYRLPAGDWPAPVYINDQARRKLILVDMDDAPASASGKA
jgi:hypothetical protein